MDEIYVTHVGDEHVDNHDYDDTTDDDHDNNNGLARARDLEPEKNKLLIKNICLNYENHIFDVKSSSTLWDVTLDPLDRYENLILILCYFWE